MDALANTASWCARHPAWTILLALTLTAGLGAGMTQAEAGRVQELFVPDGLESVATLEQIEHLWGTSDTLFLVYITEDPLAPDLLETIRADAAMAANLPGYQEAHVLPNMVPEGAPRQAYEAAGEQAGLLAPDAQLVRIFIDPTEDVMGVTDAFNQIRDASAANPIATGPIYLERSQQEGANLDVAILMPISVVMIGVVLAIVFRRAQDVLVPMVTASLALAMAYGTVAWAGLPLAPPSFIVMPLLLGVGIDYMLHIVYAYREVPKHTGIPTRFAVTADRVGAPVFFTAITTLIGFGSFLAGDIPQIRVWGLLIGSGALYAFLLGFTVLPALYRLRAGKATKPPLGDLLGGLAQRIVDNRRMVLAGLIVITVALGAVATQVNVERTLDFDLGDTPAAADLEAMQSRFGGQSLALFLVRDGPMEAIAAFESDLRDIDAVGFVDGPATRQAQGRPANDITNGPYSLITVGYPGQENAVVDELAAAGAASGLNARLTGKDVIQTESQGVVLDSLFASTGVALVLVVLLLALIFRHVRHGLLAFIPLVVMVIWQLGIQTLVGIPLNAVTGVVTAMTLGIGVDYSLHLVMHYRGERRRGADRATSSRLALASVGRPVMAATITTVSAFSVLAFSSFEPLRHFGIVAAIVVACAFVVSLTLVPALAAGRMYPQAAQAPARTPTPKPQRSAARASTE